MSQAKIQSQLCDQKCILSVNDSSNYHLYNTSEYNLHLCNMSHVMRKPAFWISANKGGDQLHGKHAAYQRLCFRYIDSTIPLLP